MPKVHKRSPLSSSSPSSTGFDTDIPGDGDGAAAKKPVQTRPAATVTRLRFTSEASTATQAVLSHFYGPVYALDRKPHLAQHYTVLRADASPAKVAAAILSEIVGSLEHNAVKWKSSPAIRQWPNLTNNPVAVPQIVAHAKLPKTFPEPGASIVWVENSGLAGRGLCVEFALTETDSGIITGFSYRYDLSGTPYILAVEDAPILAPATSTAPIEPAAVVKRQRTPAPSPSPEPLEIVPLKHNSAMSDAFDQVRAAQRTALANAWALPASAQAPTTTSPSSVAATEQIALQRMCGSSQPR